MNSTNYNNNKRLSFFAALLLGAMALLGLQACGGGGSSAPVPEPVPDVDVSGIYDGTFTQSGGGVFNLQGVIHENRAMFILEDGTGTAGNALIYDGTLTIDGNTFSSSFKEYNQSETTLTGSAFDITGSVDENAVVTITATSPTLGQGTIRLTSNTARLAIGADLNNIIFSWRSASQTFVGDSLRLSFSNANFIGNDPVGVYSGSLGSCVINPGSVNEDIRVTIPDATKNTYLITTIINCNDAPNNVLNGTYTGLIYSTGTTDMDNLIYIVAKDDRAIAAVMVD